MMMMMMMMMMIISSIIAVYVLTETAANATLRMASVFARLFVQFSFSDQNTTSIFFFYKTSCDCKRFFLTQN